MSAHDMTLLSVADVLESGRALLDAAQPEVLLVDLGLPSGSGIESIRYATLRLPACHVLVITVFW
jgi:DNA-binding NarL/FixJ family response regulator